MEKYLNVLKSSIGLFLFKKEEVENVRNNFTLMQTIIAMVIVSVVTTIFVTLIEGALATGVITALLASIFILIGGLIMYPIIIGVLYVSYAFSHLFFSLFGGSASLDESERLGFTLVNGSSIISTFLQIFITILFAAGLLTEASIFNFETSEIGAMAIILLTISILLGLWSFAVFVFSFANLHNLSYMKAFLASLMPILIILFIVGGAVLTFQSLFLGV